MNDHKQYEDEIDVEIVILTTRPGTERDFIETGKKQHPTSSAGSLRGPAKTASPKSVSEDDLMKGSTSQHRVGKELPQAKRKKKRIAREVADDLAQLRSLERKYKDNSQKSGTNSRRGLIEEDEDSPFVDYLDYF